MPIETKDAPGFRRIYDGMLFMGINIFIGFALLSLAFTLWRLARKETSQHEKYLLLAAWGILPPLWFMLEYFYIFLPYGITGSFNFFQYGQSVASKIWAAILALISISLYSSSKEE